MRIRKRFLSLYGGLTTPPSSDLHGGNHNNHHQPPPLVQHQELHPNRNQSHYPLLQSSSDHTPQIGVQPDTQASSDDRTDRNKTKISNELEYEEKKEPIKIECRKESIMGTEAKNHDLVIKGWLQGDSLVPTKKKRGSYGTRRWNKDVVKDNDEIERTMKLKDMKKNKNLKREGVTMEGSRCSRVNGRGWRCSQQTIVGYSLCEHHLGKGRVRSMTGTSVRAQTSGRKDKKAKSPSIDHDEIEHDDDDYDDGDDDEFKDWDVESVSSMEGTKVFSKKTKVGLVKARSLSSLLNQISS